MGKSKKELTLTSKFLSHLYLAHDFLLPFVSIPEFKKRALFGSYGSYRSSVYKLYKRGWIKFVNKDAQRFIKLTGKGQLRALLAKAKHPLPQKWDGKWRMIIFDIPEEAKELRNQLRNLLKENDFFKLQASVYVNPYSLNREAIKYLQETKLLPYIRILKIEEVDNDSDLKKHFNLV